MIWGSAMKQIRHLVAVVAFMSSLLFGQVWAQEIYVGSVNLPGASLDQEITYFPTKADYETTRDEILEKLKQNNSSAMANPIDGPWMIVETTAKIGMEYKGVGVAEGRKHVRRITAAEEALFIYEKEKAGK
jgi:hypothetical protein